MGGSIAYEMALVAMGITQYAVISSAYLWDIAAGVIIALAVFVWFLLLPEGDSSTGMSLWVTKY